MERALQRAVVRRTNLRSIRGMSLDRGAASAAFGGRRSSRPRLADGLHDSGSSVVLRAGRTQRSHVLDLVKRVRIGIRMGLHPIGADPAACGDVE